MVFIFYFLFFVYFVRRAGLALVPAGFNMSGTFMVLARIEPVSAKTKSGEGGGGARGNLATRH